MCLSLFIYMKVSELCKMIEDSIHSGIYPIRENQRRYTQDIQIINRSFSSEINLKNNNKDNYDIKVEVRIKDLYVLNNYNLEIQHLPGIIEADVLDSFNMLCRRLEMIDGVH